MAVQSDTSRISYTGNNSTSTSYAVPFYFLENSHLSAIAKVTATGVETVVTLTNHTGAGDPNGGTVRTAVAVPATSTLTIFRTVPATQTTTYQEGGDFPAASHERALDKLTLLAQQNERAADRAIKVTEADGARTDMVAVANSIIGLDGNKQPKAMTASEVKTYLALSGVTLDVDAGIKTFSDASERALAVPDFTGQLGTQRDTGRIYISTGTDAGNWSLVDEDLSLADFASGFFTADATGRGKFASGFVDVGLIADEAVTIPKLAHPQYTGFRNRIINGDFRVAQRGTSFASGSNNDDTYNLDRWYVLSDGNDAVDITKTTTEIPTNGQSAIALDVETANKKFGIAQIIEDANCAGLIGGTVTLSFKAKVSSTAKLNNVKAAIVAWTSPSIQVTSDIVSAWGAEGTNPTLITYATYENTPTNLNVTTSYATYTVTANLDTADTKNIIVFIWSDVTDTTAGDFLYITDVQIESGSVATPFEFRPVQTELALCQRYFFRFLAASGNVFGPSRNSSTTEARAIISFPVPMRMSISAVSTSGTAGDYMILHGATLTSASAAPSFIDGTRYNCTVAVPVASGLTAGQASQLAANSASAHLSFSAEL